MWLSVFFRFPRTGFGCPVNSAPRATFLAKVGGGFHRVCSPKAGQSYRGRPQFISFPNPKTLTCRHLLLCLLAIFIFSIEFLVFNLMRDLAHDFPDLAKPCVLQLRSTYRQPLKSSSWGLHSRESPPKSLSSHEPQRCCFLKKSVFWIKKLVGYGHPLFIDKMAALQGSWPGGGGPRTQVNNLVSFMAPIRFFDHWNHSHFWREKVLPPIRTLVKEL